MYTFSVFGFASYLDRFYKSDYKTRIVLKFMNNVYLFGLIITFIRVMSIQIYLLTGSDLESYKDIDLAMHNLLEVLYNRNLYMPLALANFLIYGLILNDFCYYKIPEYLQPIFRVFENLINQNIKYNLFKNNDNFKAVMSKIKVLTAPFLAQKEKLRLICLLFRMDVLFGAFISFWCKFNPHINLYILIYISFFSLFQYDYRYCVYNNFNIEN